MNKFLQLDNKTLFVVALLSADFLLGLRKKVTSEYITKVGLHLFRSDHREREQDQDQLCRG